MGTIGIEFGCQLSNIGALLGVRRWQGGNVNI